MYFREQRSDSIRHAMLSAIVDTMSSPAKLQIVENTTVPIVDLANEYLREILSILIHEPKYLDPITIDKLLLTGKK